MTEKTIQQPVKRRAGRPRHTEPSEEYKAKLESVVEAAAKVFHEKGYAKGTLDDVAAVLDIRKASLYHYVRSKDALLNLVFEQALSKGAEDLRRLSELEDPRERLRAIIRFQVTIVTSERDHFAVFFDQMGAPGAGRSTSVRKREREYLQVFVDAVKEAAEAGVIPPVDALFGAQAIIGMTSWSYKWFDESRHDVEQFVDACVALVLGSAGG